MNCVMRQFEGTLALACSLATKLFIPRRREKIQRSELRARYCDFSFVTPYKTRRRAENCAIPRSRGISRAARHSFSFGYISTPSLVSASLVCVCRVCVECEGSIFASFRARREHVCVCKRQRSRDGRYVLRRDNRFSPRVIRRASSIVGVGKKCALVALRTDGCLIAVVVAFSL